MPYFLHIFALKLNCRTASKGWGGRHSLIYYMQAGSSGAQHAERTQDPIPAVLGIKQPLNPEHPKNKKVIQK